MECTQRNAQSELPVHDIPDGSERVDPFDLDNERVWAEENGVNILGTPMGSPAFVSSYLKGKGIKHLLLQFIKDVASAGFPREAELMLKDAAVPRMSHILRSVKKSHHSRGWMRDMDGAHDLSAGLHCLIASEVMEHALGTEGMSLLSDLLDLPPSYGGAGLQ